MSTLASNVAKSPLKMTRREKSRRKKFERRRFIFFAISFLLIIASIFIFNFSKKRTALKAPDTALNYYMTNSFNSKLERIDSFELIYSHEGKSIYKVYGLDNSETFKIYEVSLVKGSSNWNIDNLKNLN
ncbi:hypothetical protein [uncultured Clostridium sp.]|uniref:hypothetical protein n=1 Tax=uncultured Clostridium sp. TaxID=59620 RepID=UPI0026213E25|nr:hypothetical protein [uncultured Clostridium sp.]